MTSQDAPRIDTSIPHPARRYNYWLGGKDHFQADRDSGDQLALLFPPARLAALANRAFLGRAVRTLARAGIHQFLDIGTGIPAPGNTHEVAQSIVRQAHVVYVDNDPIVLAHARALMTSAPGGATAYIDADLRDWQSILTNPDLLKTIDLSQPVGLMLVAILHFLPDDDEVKEIVSGLIGRLVPGSYLVLSHVTYDLAPAELRDVPIPATHGDLRMRSHDQLMHLLEGLEILEPGVVPVPEWRPDGNDTEPRLSREEAGIYAVVARIP